jgi:hypothetical protein
VSEVRASLVRDASATTTLVQQQLTDAIQILYVGKQRLDAAFSKGPVTERLIHDQLSETISSFRAFNIDGMLGVEQPPFQSDMVHLSNT